MTNDSLIPTIKELERVYDLIADRYKFKAPRPIITIQTKGRQSALGWHWKNKWRKGEIELTEINICAEELDKNPIETLIHEMVHYHNAVDEIKDCNSQQYHNSHFKQRAEEYGLNVKRAGRYGWGMTSLSDKLQEVLIGYKINYDVFKLIRKHANKIKAETKMKKYSCGCTIVRCATELSAVCETCQNRFEEKE